MAVQQKTAAEPIQKVAVQGLSSELFSGAGALGSGSPRGPSAITGGFLIKSAAGTITASTNIPSAVYAPRQPSWMMETRAPRGSA